MKPPLPHSYWVEPGRLLAGEHPAGSGEAATRDRVSKLQAAGVRAFIDLTEPGERPDYAALLAPDVIYENHPFRDHSVPRAQQQMQAILRSVQQYMDEGAVYVHCRAGIGRTGLTVGCWLREQGLAPSQAIERLNQLWQQNARSAQWPSVPETDEQEAYVLAWRPVGSAPQADKPTAAGDASQSLRQYYRGCLGGMAVADAFANSDAAAPAGWTDDTAMTLCVAESLLARRGFDGRDQLERFRAWSRDPARFGAVATARLRPAVSSVLARAVWNRSAVLGTHDPAQIDPSPLPRCAAVALFSSGQPGVAASLGADVARVTHQAPVLVDACRLLSAMIAQALCGAAQEQLLDAARHCGGTPLRAEVLDLAATWGASTGRRRPPAGVLGVLDAAVRSFIREADFEAGLQRVLQSRNPDRDAVCAVYGALAGAFHGEQAIPSAMCEQLPNLSTVWQLADQLHDNGSALHAAL